ncbi:MAG: penicillin-binding protein 2 [Saprospiraceae bacterium]|nr:penicillin-binding protein 2 [Saprospiraceae bacterium]
MSKEGASAYLAISTLFIVASVILLGKVCYLQLFDDSFKDRSRTYAIKKQWVYPSRGLIYDRHQRLLVHNEGSFDLMVTYHQLDPAMDTAAFCRLLDIDHQTYLDNIQKDWSDVRYSKHVPFVFLSKVSPEVFSRTRELLFNYPGFYFQNRNVRAYPYPVGAHVMGYLGEVNRAQVDSSNGVYLPGDYIGLSGLEAAYEGPLKGERGMRYLLKDNVGRIVGSYLDGKQDREPVSGKDILSTIDIDLTAYAEQLLKNKRGSIVAIDPSTGEILAMVSSPYYDPNLLTINQSRGKAFQALDQDSLKPFFDRSIMAKYPPGSIFKTIVGLIAMQEGLTYAQRKIPCTGAYYYKDESWGCHHHWPVNNIQSALTVSCNTYFFTLTREILDKYGAANVKLGLDNFNKYLRAFGLGHPLEMELKGEKGGFIPDPAYYDRLYNKRKWYSPTIMNIGVGQGELQLTTLQMANLAAIIGNRGYYYIPHLVREFLNDTTQIDPKYHQRIKVPVDPKYFEPIVSGLEQVIQYGTAHASFIPGIPYCGKTGTSQNPHGKDHSVFFGFAPRNNPRIAIAVYIENAGWGGDYAAPIASLVLEKYLKGEISLERLALEQRMIQTNVNALP